MAHVVRAREARQQAGPQSAVIALAPHRDEHAAHPRDAPTARRPHHHDVGVEAREQGLELRLVARVRESRRAEQHRLAAV